MGEEGGQPSSAPCTAAFHSAGRHLEDAGGLRHGIALHVHENQCGPLFGGKCAERRQKFAVQILTLGRRLSGLVGLQELFEPLGVVDG